MSSEQIVIIAIFGCLIVLFAWMTVAGKRMEKRRQAFLEALHHSGRRVQARVESVGETGVWMDRDRFEVILVLSIPSENGSSYQAKTTVMLPMTGLTAIQPGRSIAVWVSATDPGCVVVDKDALLPLLPGTEQWFPVGEPGPTWWRTFRL